MGNILKFTCKECGFSTDDLFVGPGFMGEIKGFECMECHNIMSKSVDADGKIIDDEKNCSFCGSENLVPWDGSCPKCKNKMDSEWIGLWD